VVLAAAVAVLHGVAVAFMVSGSLLALRWPRVLWLHVPLVVAILGIYLTGSDCPLTALELWLRERAGRPGYSGGFIGHYLTEPLGRPIHAASTQVAIVLIAVLPNVIGYALLALRWVQRRMARPEPLAASVRGRQQVSAELLEQPDEAVIAPPLEDPSVGQPVDFATGPAHGRTPERFDAPSTGE
jgi:hypothetical protein